MITTNPDTGKTIRINDQAYRRMTVPELIREYGNIWGTKKDSKSFPKGFRSRSGGGWYGRLTRSDLIVDLIRERADNGDTAAIAWLDEAVAA